MNIKKDFFSESAQFYDFFYKKKNYSKEFEYINKFLPKKKLEILEVGCGTGSYSILLSKKNKKVYGIDISNQMILLAKKKAELKKIYNVEFRKKNVIKFKTKKRYDVCIMMFNVINYIKSKKDLKLLFKIIHGSLKNGGIFLFDQWKFSNINKNNFQTREIEINKTKVIRNAFTYVDKLHQKLIVKYDYEIKVPFRKNNQKFTELHRLKVHNIDEIKKAIKNKFKIIKYLKWMSVKKKPKRNDNQSFMVIQKI